MDEEDLRYIVAVLKNIAIALTLVLTTMIGIFGCSRSSRDDDPNLEGYNVLVVMVDTLRADHMSLYGYERPTTPFIDRFFSKAVVFEHARSQASCTHPSVNSLLTSRNPAIFTRSEHAFLGIPEEYPGIAEILQQQGYRTIAVSASPIVRATASDFNPSGGFDRGFDVFAEDSLWKPGAHVSRELLAQIDTAEEPFFAYAHFMDPHGPYRPPENYERVFAGEYEGHQFIKRGRPVPISKVLSGERPDLVITEGDIQHLVDLYDDEIRYFDKVFRRLIKSLEKRDLLERTIIVFTSDHGEEFMEHNSIRHCRGVWDTVTRVPLMIRVPGADGGRRVASAVQNLDIVPTILDLIEIETEEVGFEGISLRPHIEGGEAPRTYAFADQLQYRGADDGLFHLIWDGDNDTTTLFDLTNDPLEQNDLFSPDHPEFAHLRQALDGWLADTGQTEDFNKELAAAAAREEELRALGYLH